MRYLIALIALTALVATANAAEVKLEDGTLVEITVINEQSRIEAVECSAFNTTGCELGSLKYCTYYQDAEENDSTGFSFEDQSFRRACDTNADGRYDFCLDYVAHVNGTYTFLDQSYYRYCAIDIDFNPTQGRVLAD
jgi:hypothetical protein